MGCCYSGGHFTENHIHTDITAYNIKKPQKKYRLGTVSKRFLKAGRFNMFYWIQPVAPRATRGVEIGGCFALVAGG